MPLRRRIAPPPYQPYKFLVIEEEAGRYIAQDQKGKTRFRDTNVTAVIQSALNALTSGRTWKEKVILRGNFTIDDIIKIPSYTTLEIQGKITLADGRNVDMFENSDQVNGNSYIEINGGILDGNKANQTAGHGIHFYRVDHSVIKEVRVVNAFNDGIRWDGPATPLQTYNKLESCEALTCGGAGFYLMYHTATRILNNLADDNGARGFLLYSIRIGCEVKGNIARYNGDDGFEISECVEIELSGNTSHHNVIGLHITGGGVLDVTGWIIFGNSQHGVVVDGGVEQVTISGCGIVDNGMASDNTYDGIYVNAIRTVIEGNVLITKMANRNRHGIHILADRCTVSGNWIALMATDGIRLTDALDAIITGNNITGCGGYGVNETGISDYTLLDGNNLRGNTTGAHTVDALNSLVGDNIV